MSAQSCRVLVVDDSPEVLESVAAFLEDEGYAVCAAATAAEGLAAIEERRPDVGIIDMRLPGMDGNDFIEQAHARHPSMRFIIYTGSLEYQLPESLTCLGIAQDDVVTKPAMDMMQFVKIIQRLLSAD